MLPEPLLRQIRRLILRVKRKSNELLAGQYESAVRGSGLTFAEVRPYQPGDDIRHIDWNVTARTGAPHIKQFIEERERVIYLLVDVSASQQFGSREAGVGSRGIVTKRQVAAESAALIAFAAAARRDRVGLIHFTDRIEQALPPRKGGRHAHRLVQSLFTIRSVNRGTDIARALTSLRRKRRSVVFLISDFQAAGWDRALKIAARRHDVVAIIVRDPAELELPHVGRVRLSDAETGVSFVLNTANQTTRSLYHRRMEQRRDEIIKRIRSAGADIIELTTAGGHLDAIVRFFRSRERRP